MPNEFGGREDLDAVAFLKELNEVAARPRAGRRSPPPRSRPPGRASRGPTYLGGLGFGFKWNMGWMHDTLGVLPAGPDLPPLPPPRADVQRSSTRSRENFILPLSHDEVVHGKGSLLSTRCRATAGRSSRTCARCTPTCGRTPARSCCSWARSSRRSASGATSARSTGTCSSTRSTPASSRWCATSTARYRDEPALWERDFDADGLLVDRAQRRRRQRGRVRARVAGRRARARVRRQPVAGAARGLPARAAARRAAGARRSTPTRPTTAARTSGNLGGVEAEPIPWHGQPFSAEITLPPLGAIWLVPEEKAETPRRRS